MKKLNLILNTLQFMFRQHTFFAVWLAFLQAITAFAGIFFFSAVPKATADLASSLVGFRSAMFSFSPPSSEYSYEELSGIIADNGTAIPENYSFVFYSGENCNLISDTDEKSRAGGVVKGRGITAEDIENRSRVAVAGDNGETQPGQKIKIGGTDFEIVGLKNESGNYFEIPYTTGFDLFAVSEFQVTFPEGLADGQIDNMCEYIASSVHNCEPLERMNVSEFIISSNGTMIVTAVFVMIIALFNLCFVYKFILKRMSGYFAILRICGDSSKGIAGLIYAVYGVILTASFAAGTAVLFIVKLTSDFAVLVNTDINFKVILTVFAAFAAIMSIFLLQAVKALRKPVKEEMLT